ncbi:MAG TPA: winged helix-turn-helix transcriptional regulator [Candidatus Nanoarchaeia archaeon]|nr:winged helix-turn-helix transcriptional regulator [Candidatus Nanoarchaeia archaeon]
MSLIMHLSANSRLSYAELAKKLNLSVNAVHKRIQLLIETGVICKFTAKVSLFSATAIVVFVSGTSQLSSFQDLPAKLKTNGSIYWLAEGGGKFLYIGAYLQNINQLADLLNYIEKEAKIPEPTTGIMASAPIQFNPNLKSPDLSLCELDYKIINALKDDSRKAISEIAATINISAKTVRRRLSRMTKNNLIELGLEWYPDKSNDIITLIDVHLKPNTDINTAPFQILRKYAPNTLFYWTFANIPNKVTFTVWTNTMNELQNLRERLETEPTVNFVVPNILYKGYIFSTWRDKLAANT